MSAYDLAYIDRLGTELEQGTAYRFYGESCSRCRRYADSHSQKLNLKECIGRYDKKAGPDHYDQLKFVPGEESRVWPPHQRVSPSADPLNPTTVNHTMQLPLRPDDLDQ